MHRTRTLLLSTFMALLPSTVFGGIPSPEAFIGGQCANMGGCFCSDGHGVPWNADCSWGSGSANEATDSSAPSLAFRRKVARLKKQCNTGTAADGWGHGDEPGKAGYRCRSLYTPWPAYWDCRDWLPCRR